MGPGHVTAEHAWHGRVRAAGIATAESPLRPGHGVDFLIEALRAATSRSVTVCALGR
jgi:hypothetical protein